MSDLDDFIDMLMDEEVGYAVVYDVPSFMLDEPQGAYAVVDYEINEGFFFVFGPILRGKHENQRAERKY